METRPMTQSEKGLMEKTWERIQRKTFTGWCNNHLRKRGLKIDDLETDLEDGLKLIALLEIISNETFPYKFERKPTIRLKKIANVGLCLKFIHEKGVKLVGIGAEEIVDGNIKLILGMIWIIILRFQIQDISMEELSAKEGLLLWCKKKTEGYKDVKVENFHFSFQNGLALCALIHRHRPDLLDFSSLSSENKAQNLQLAFDIAERELDVPKLLDVTDMIDVPKPDERSVMTYVSLLYHVFSASQQAEVAGRRVGKIIDFLQTNEQLKSDYQTRAQLLVNWINARTTQLAERAFDGTLEGVQFLISAFKSYKTVEKKPHSEEKIQLETLYNALQTKLNLNGRPPFVPDEGLSPSEIQNSWDQLEKIEHDRALAIREELRRMKKIEELLRQFNLRVEKLEHWSILKEVVWSSEEFGHNLTEVRAKIKNYEIFEGEFEGQEFRLKALVASCNELIALQYKDAERVKTRLEELTGNWSNLHRLAKVRKESLAQEFKKQQQIEDWVLDFSKRSLQLTIWLDNADEILTYPLHCESLEGVLGLRQKFDFLCDQLKAKKSEFEAIQKLSGRLDELGVNKSLFCETNMSKLEYLWTSIDTLKEKRRSLLLAEVQKQKANQTLCETFAEKGMAFVSLCHQNSRFVSIVSGNPEEQLKELNELKVRLVEMEANLIELQELNQQIEDAQIDENTCTENNMETLKGLWSALNTFLNQKVESLEKEMHARSDTSLSPEQVKEFKECFNHFDVDKDNYLSRLELGACLRALGQDFPLEKEVHWIQSSLRSIKMEIKG